MFRPREPAQGGDRLGRSPSEAVVHEGLHPRPGQDGARGAEGQPGDRLPDERGGQEPIVPAEGGLRSDGGDENDGGDPHRCRLGDGQGDPAAPAVPDCDGAGDAHVVEQIEDGGGVAGEAPGRPASAAVAGSVGDHDGEVGGQERDDRVPVGGGSRLAVEQDHRGALAVAVAIRRQVARGHGVLTRAVAAAAK